MPQIQWRPLAWGAGGALGVGVIVFLILQTWFTWNRAIDGEKAWICLNTPACVASVVRPK